MDDLRIGFIGAGVLGRGLSLALSTRGYRVAAVSSRSRRSAEDLAARIPGSEALEGPQQVADRCQLVFITTPDEVIGQVASQAVWRRGQGVVHCSGAESVNVLDPAARLGASTGSFHPFQTLACVDTPEEAAARLSGATFAVEALDWLRDFLRDLASRLGGKSILVRPEDRPIYHASAVMACGYLVALIKAATDMWGAMGVPPGEALSTILPLAKSTLANLSSDGMEASVTGPLVRGDTAIVQGHLEALESRLPRLVPLYCTLSQESLPFAGEGVGPNKLEAMERLIKGYARKYARIDHD